MQKQQKKKEYRMLNRARAGKGGMLALVLAASCTLCAFTPGYKVSSVVTPPYNPYSGEIGYIVVKGEAKNQIESTTTDIMEQSRNLALLENQQEMAEHRRKTQTQIKTREEQLKEEKIKQALERIKEKEKRKKQLEEDRKLEEQSLAEAKEKLRSLHHQQYLEELEKASSDAEDNSKSTYIYSNDWTGEKLTPSKGTIIGPSGKETYYNLPMSLVVTYMRALGFDAVRYPYHVRSDGVKCLGPYVMCAADLSIRPKGTFVKTSLGTGLVCDTGTFASSNPTQLDIAVSW